MCFLDLGMFFGCLWEVHYSPWRVQTWSFSLDFHVFLVITSSPGDLKDTMVFIRREAIEGIPSEIPFSTKCLWKDLRDLV